MVAAERGTAGGDAELAVDCRSMGADDAIVHAQFIGDLGIREPHHQDSQSLPSAR